MDDFEAKIKGYFDPEKDKPYFDLPKEDSKKIKKLKEKLKVAEFEDKVETNTILSKNHKKLEDTRTSMFWKVFAIFCLGIIIFGGYLTFYTDKLDSFISPSFNNSVEVNNNYTNNFENKINNEYEHKIYNNVTIINEIYLNNETG